MTVPNYIPTPSEERKLLPCKYCGGSPKLIKCGDQKEYVVYLCSKCFETPVHADEARLTEYEARKIWNKRTREVLLMDLYIATEQAYKNGYETGYQKAKDEIGKEIFNEIEAIDVIGIFLPSTRQRIWTEQYNKLKKKYIEDKQNENQD